MDHHKLLHSSVTVKLPVKDQVSGLKNSDGKVFDTDVDICEESNYKYRILFIIEDSKPLALQ